MYRKITVIFISVFLRISGVITQALVIFLVLIMFLILNLKLMPFAFKSLNDMEMLSIITSMLTIYWGLFYLSHLPEVYNSSDSSVQEADNGRKSLSSSFVNIWKIVRISPPAQWFFFLVILLSNILFLAYWVYKMIEEIKNTLRDKFEKVYLYICLCGNKDRLENEKRRRAIDDENEILKEEFDERKEIIDIV